MRIFKSSIAATSAPDSAADQGRAPSRSARPTRSSALARSAKEVILAIVALPRRARACRIITSVSGPVVGTARARRPSSCSTYSLASRMKKSRKPGAGFVMSGIEGRRSAPMATTGGRGRGATRGLTKLGRRSGLVHNVAELVDGLSQADEDARADAGVIESGDPVTESVWITRHVETTFSRNFLSTFRNHRDLMRPKPGRDSEHLVRACHLEIQDGSDRGCESLDVDVLNVPPVFAQMRGDTVGTGPLAESGRGDGVRLAAAPRLANSRHVIDVDVQSLSFEQERASLQYELR